MILIKLVIIFFIYLIIAHILSLHTVIEGLDKASPDLSAQYQENSQVSGTQQYTTSQQAGAISGLRKTAKSLREDIKKMKKTISDINRTAIHNMNKIESLQSEKCGTSHNLGHGGTKQKQK